MQGHLERKSLKVSMIILKLPTDELFEHFRRFSKTLYISTCIKNKNEDENEGQIRKESEIWFDYIFENEKYPR